MTTATKQNGATAVATVPKASPIYSLAARFQIEPTKLVEVLRGTVIKPDKNGKQATNEEVAAFCIVANQYGLNPFTREIHAFVSNGSVVPIVGIDGWTHIVNVGSAFDGCEFIDEADENGVPISITCKMYVKGRTHPVCARERFLECKRPTAPWNTMPWRMLRHKAYMQAARYAFGLSGIYDEDEARDIVKNGQPDPAPAPLPIGRQSLKAKPAPANTTFTDETTDAEFTEPTIAADPDSPEAMFEEINREFLRTGAAHHPLKKQFNVKEWTELQPPQCRELLATLKEMPDAREPGTDDK